MGNILKLSKIRKRSTRNYKCTNIEKIVRNGLYSKGYRYRVNVHSLKGRPDLVLPKYNAIIFVNGCYWHAHNCDLFKIPSSNRGLWLKRFGETVDRDEKNIKLLIENGWRVCVVWECSLREDIYSTIKALSDWIQGDKKFYTIEKDRKNFFKKNTQILKDKNLNNKIKVFA
jgi:DNA mismatch endonuclease, patch repair protein